MKIQAGTDKVCIEWSKKGEQQQKNEVTNQNTKQIEQENIFPVWMKMGHGAKWIYLSSL